jgi:23S rRNA (pseudouridine1915-N3)-methyltransferase
MMTVKLVCVGKLKEKHFSDAFNEYTKRLGRFCKIELAEVDEYLLSKNPSKSEIQKGLEKEGLDLLKHLSGFPVCLDVDGKQLSSEEFSETLSKASNGYSAITFLIGSSYGISQNVKEQCKLRLSFGKMTFPHQLFRVMLAEQIYRSFMIASNSDYHK